MQSVRRIAKDNRIKEGLASCRRRAGIALDLAISIQQIPAPTFAEGERADNVERRFSQLGLKDVAQDAIHNVYARLPGKTSAWPVIVSAHTDTVFSLETDLTVRHESNGQNAAGSRVSGPGLADNALGVAGLLVLATQLMEAELPLIRDVWFVANVCEEGLGDLRGMKSVVDRFGPEAQYIIVEGGSYGHVFHKAIGVRRFRLEVQVPGGHSWGDYGSPSAIHILSRIIERLDRLQLPMEPKTTINVGVIEGGTTINTIAARASCQIDLRSVDPNLLEKLVADVEAIVHDTTSLPDVSAIMTVIGSRPAGALPQETPLVRNAAEALRIVGIQEIFFMAGSTDANVPISRGIPSVCIGLANSGNTHRTDEYLEPERLPEGLGQLLLLTVAAAGLEDVK